MKKDILASKVGAFLRMGCITVTIAALLPSSRADAQASLAAENIIDDVSVDIDGNKEVFTLFRDARNEKQWYYVPNRPRLVTHAVGGRIEPEFSLLRYQFPDPENAAKLVEEGILQFAASLAAPPAAISAFKDAIKDKKQQQNVTVSAIPFKSADVAIYSYAAPGQTSALIGSTPYGSGIAPLFASQSMAFSVPLTRIGSDVMNSLVTGGTGVPIAITFTFNALTPPAGFKVTVNWDQTFSHYSSDAQFRASASYFGYFGASYNRSVQKIREDLENHGDIKVETISGESFSQSDIDKYLQPILARINEELVEAAKPPPQIDPAKASAPSAGGWFGSAGYSVAIKDVKKVKKGSETWVMTNQAIVERKTIAQGFMGIGSYDDITRNRLVTTVPGTSYSSAYFLLPSPALASELGISALDLQVSLQNQQNAIASQVVRWTPGGQWKDVDSQERTTLVFGLAAALAADPNIKNSHFETKLNVTTNDQVLSISSTVPAFNGQNAMPGVNQALFEVIDINPSLLSFAALGNGDLVLGNATVTVGKTKYSRTLQPKIVNGQPGPPDDIHVLVPREPDGTLPTVTAAIHFQAKGGGRYDWKYNGQDLRNAFDGFSFALLQEDLVKH